MRTAGLEATADGDFYPAIRHSETEDLGSVRHPTWHVVRVDVAAMPVFHGVVGGVIGLEVLDLRYEFRRPREKPTERRWLPGYVFVKYDEARDRWQQIHRAPGVFAVLGPVSDAVVDDLVARLPYRPAKPNSFTIIRPGTRVEILRGPMSGWGATVSGSDSRKNEVVVELVMFGRILSSTLRAGDVCVVG